MSGMCSISSINCISFNCPYGPVYFLSALWFKLRMYFGDVSNVLKPGLLGRVLVSRNDPSPSKQKWVVNRFNHSNQASTRVIGLTGHLQGEYPLQPIKAHTQLAPWPTRKLHPHTHQKALYTRHHRGECGIHTRACEGERKARSGRAAVAASRSLLWVLSFWVCCQLLLLLSISLFMMNIWLIWLRDSRW